MAQAYFISQKYLKDNSPLAANVDIKELYPFARTAEEIYIQEAIGTSLFNRLVESLNASPQNTTADEITLLLKIRDCTLWYTCFEALPFLAIKLRNIGVVKQTDANLESGSRDDVSYLRNLCKTKAEHYMRILQRYLCENSNLFAEYRCSGWNCSEILPTTRVSTGCDLAFDRDDDDIDTEFARKWLS